MPHVIVKMYRGRDEEVKQQMVDGIVKSITASLDIGEGSVSVAVEEFEPERWNEEVYLPDIAQREDYLYKKPGYKP
ncbi:MAG: 4-oxalocrotonate tautomerase [Clostridiaceae bacterium]|nr:4-oxalocrotonate tautomerase [Clostridiaceae bacterium]